MRRMRRSCDHAIAADLPFAMHGLHLACLAVACGMIVRILLDLGNRMISTAAPHSRGQGGDVAGQAVAQAIAGLLVIVLVAPATPATGEVGLFSVASSSTFNHYHTKCMLNISIQNLSISI